MLGSPSSILIYKGKINYESLKRQQINLDELFEELRLAGYFDLNEIQYAILENNGQLSFLTSQSDYNKSSSYDNYYNFNNQSSSSLRKDSSNAKNSSKDSNNSSNEESDSKPTLPIIYVLDGHINKNILTTSGKSRDWIENELRKYNINSINDVLIAMIDTHGEFVYQLYDKNKKVKGAKK